MDFLFGLGKIETFWTITPTHSIIISHVAPLIGLTMLVQKGGGWCYSTTSCTFLAIVGLGMLRGIYGYGIGIWWYGGIRTWWHLSTFCMAIIKHAPNFGCWGCSIIPTQSVRDHEDMGAKDWPINYKPWSAWSMIVNMRFHSPFCF
jgi:hypothetical protein